MYGLWYMILLFSIILSNIPPDSIDYKPVWGFVLVIAGIYDVKEFAFRFCEGQQGQ